MIKNVFKAFALALPVVATILSGCTGFRTFHDYANAGDTVAVAAGWMHNMQRGNIEVKITDNLGTVTTYTPGQPGYNAVRASINLYPDPVSSMVVSNRINKDLTPSATTYSNLINGEVTNGDNDWWETVIFIDLPDPMALGDATINITGLSNPVETMSSVVTIVPDATGTGTGGTPNSFEATLTINNEIFPFNVADPQMQAMERVSNYEVAFSGSTLPYAIQIDFTHDPDEANSGTGTPYIINPIGHIKNLSWAATGTSGTDLRVILTPARDGEITNMNDFKFYVAGGVTNLAPNGSVQAFDIGGVSVPGVSVTITNN